MVKTPTIDMFHAKSGAIPILVDDQHKAKAVVIGDLKASKQARKNQKLVPKN